MSLRRGAGLAALGTVIAYAYPYLYNFLVYTCGPLWSGLISNEELTAILISAGQFLALVAFTAFFACLYLEGAGKITHGGRRAGASVAAALMLMQGLYAGWDVYRTFALGARNSLAAGCDIPRAVIGSVCGVLACIGWATFFVSFARAEQPLTRGITSRVALGLLLITASCGALNSYALGSHITGNRSQALRTICLLAIQLFGWVSVSGFLITVFRMRGSVIAVRA